MRERICVCVCVCLRVKGSSKPRLTKFTPAVVMSAGSFWNIGAQKLRPASCVNLYIQVHDVKSSHTRAAKLEHLGEVGAHSPLPFFLHCPPWPVITPRCLGLAKSVFLLRSSSPPSHELTFHTPSSLLHTLLLCICKCLPRRMHHPVHSTV